MSNSAQKLGQPFLRESIPNEDQANNHPITLYKCHTAEKNTFSQNTAFDALKKVYWHEKQLMIAIPILLSAATTFELVESLTVLARYTRVHIELLESQFPDIANEPQ